MFHFSCESHLKIDHGIMAGQSPVIMEYGYWLLDNFQDLNFLQHINRANKNWAYFLKKIRTLKIIAIKE